MNAIRGHHDLTNCAEEHKVLAASLSIANQLCNLSGYRAHPENYAEVVDEMFSVSGIDCEALPAIAEQYFNFRSSIDELLSLAD